jgi:MraZ protein
MLSTHTNSALPMFMGEFSHAIDGKSRLTVPSAWRFEEEAEFFMLPSSKGTCLKVMPRQEVERIRAAAAALPGPQRLEVLRAIGSGTRQARLDKAGRLVVPEEFCKSLNLGAEVTLAGAIETFEIWNRQVWDASKAKSAEVAQLHLEQLGL